VEVDHPTVGPLKLLSNPMRFVGRTMGYRSPPVLGQDTAKVIEELESQASTEPVVSNRSGKDLWGK
jgi:crotonobetainyl-CoA:carnitine CoA-transferase CaiB-like acyl-CoA transferase